MQRLVVIGLVGFFGNLVNNSLGMGYGVTSASLLLAAGLTPAVVAASVNLAGTGATLASGIAHLSFGNVNWRVVGRLAVPGAVGAFVGAAVLSRIATRAATPWIAAVLAVLGGYLLLRFAVRRSNRELASPQLRRRFLAPLGIIGGFVTGSTGGGWGPIATPALLASGRLEPRQVIGSVNTAEVLVTVAASLGFLGGLGLTGVPYPIVVALLVGSLVSAPLGAWLCRLVPAPMLGVSVGGLLLVLNAHTLLAALAVDRTVFAAAYLLILMTWIVTLALAARIVVRDRRATKITSAIALQAND